MIIINWGVWYYTFVTSGKKSDSKVYSITWGKSESNLKLLKDKTLQVNNFLLLDFVLLSYRERVISQHLALVLAYFSITNNLKLTTTFLIMKSIIRKFQYSWISINWTHYKADTSIRRKVCRGTDCFALQSNYLRKNLYKGDICIKRTLFLHQLYRDSTVLIQNNNFRLGVLF